METLDEDPPKTCMDVLYYQTLQDYVKSPFYSKDFTLDEYHFPVLVGDDGAFTDSWYSFKFLDKYIAGFNKYSK